MPLTHTRSILAYAEEAISTSEDYKGSVALYKNLVLSIEDRELGTLHPTHVRIEMLFAGICGTDVHLTQKNKEGFIMTSAPLSIPKEGRVIGHEGVGKVIELGAAVKSLKLGDVVAMESIVACFQCEPCYRGEFNQCIKAKLVGMQTDGLFSHIVDFPETIVKPVGNLANSEDGLMAAACLEPAGIAWQACKRLSVSMGDRVLIFGGGPIGFFCAMMARLVFGASWVGLVEPIHFRREFASEWCDEVFDLESENITRLKFDVVIEASGFLDNISSVIDNIKANGRVAFLARSGFPLKLPHIDHLITNGIMMMGVRGHLGGVFQRMVELYTSGRLPLHKAVTSVIHSLDDVQSLLLDSKIITDKNCKVLAKLN